MKQPGQPPVVVAIAGPNGAGKTTFYRSQLRELGLLYVNADELARTLHLGPYEAAAAADLLRSELAAQRVSFCFETVFSDPVGDKVDFLEMLASTGYRVILCFIGIPTASVSEQRVAMRVSQGGHDVPSAKLEERYPRTLRNLARAIERLPDVRVFDNSDLARPYRLVAHIRREPYPNSSRVSRNVFPPMPPWLVSILDNSHPATDT